MTFAEGFEGTRAKAARDAGKTNKAFDWDKAAKLIKEHLKDHKDLVAEAGLQLDWSCTGGVIFEDGEPTNESYTYLSSNWAIPTLILEWDGVEQLEVHCYVDQSDRVNSDTKWDSESLKTLGIDLPKE